MWALKLRNLLFATRTITPRFCNIVASGSHAYDALRSVCNITPRCYNIIASSPDRTHAYDACDRSVCNHHSKILQHSRIRIAHTHALRSVCNHHSKMLQHHPIITRSHTRMRRMRLLFEVRSKWFEYEIWSIPSFLHPWFPHIFRRSIIFVWEPYISGSVCDGTHNNGT